ncbi:hypothetical protein AB4254_12225 [Vibrio breoganii]
MTDLKKSLSVTELKEMAKKRGYDSSFLRYMDKSLDVRESRTESESRYNLQDVRVWIDAHCNKPTSDFYKEEAEDYYGLSWSQIESNENAIFRIMQSAARELKSSDVVSELN